MDIDKQALIASQMAQARRDNRRAQAMAALKSGQATGNNAAIMDAMNTIEGRGGLLNSVGNFLGVDIGKDKLTGNNLQNVYGQQQPRGPRPEAQAVQYDNPMEQRLAAMPAAERRKEMEYLARQGILSPGAAASMQASIDQKANMNTGVQMQQNVFDQTAPEQAPDITQMNAPEVYKYYNEQMQKKMEGAGSNPERKKVFDEYVAAMRGADKWFGGNSAGQIKNDWQSFMKKAPKGRGKTKYETFRYMDPESEKEFGGKIPEQYMTSTKAVHQFLQKNRPEILRHDPNAAEKIFVGGREGGLDGRQIEGQQLRRMAEDNAMGTDLDAENYSKEVDWAKKGYILVTDSNGNVTPRRAKNAMNIVAKKRGLSRQELESGGDFMQNAMLPHSSMPRRPVAKNKKYSAGSYLE